MLELPLHSSVNAVAAVSYPPKTIPDVVVPPGPTVLLLLLKSATSAQLVPFQSSTLSTLVGCPPPQAKANVYVPITPGYALSVFKSPVSVHDVPFQDSVLPVHVAGEANLLLPTAKPAVTIPAPPIPIP